MKIPTEEEAIKLLKKYAPDAKSFGIVLAHVQAVKQAALDIARQIPDIDLDIIRIGSLLHDIGRFQCPPKSKDSIRHGIAGAEIVRKEGLDELFARICERHIGVGISKEDIKRQNLNLPLKDYIPETKEEKIIAHADNLVFGHEIKTLQDVIDRFRKELGEDYVKRVNALAKEIESWKKR